MTATTPRHAERIVNEGPGPPDDGKDRRVDTCPDCGAERWEILVIPDTFHCDDCRKASTGPNTQVVEREPEQIDLFGVTVDAPPPADEAPPIDEGMAWMADEGPDE